MVKTRAGPGLQGANVGPKPTPDPDWRLHSAALRPKQQQREPRTQQPLREGGGERGKVGRSALQLPVSLPEDAETTQNDGQGHSPRWEHRTHVCACARTPVASPARQPSGRPHTTSWRSRSAEQPSSFSPASREKSSRQRGCGLLGTPEGEACTLPRKGHPSPYHIKADRLRSLARNSPHPGERGAERVGILQRLGRVTPSSTESKERPSWAEAATFA